LIARETGDVSRRLAQIVHESTIRGADDSPHSYDGTIQDLGELADSRDRTVLDDAWWSVTERLTPLHEEMWSTRRRVCLELGYSSYAAAYAHWKGLDLDRAARFARELLRETETVYRRGLAEATAAQLDVSSPRAADIPRLLRGSTWDRSFPPGTLVSTCVAALVDLGVDPRELEGVTIDIEPSPTKPSRPFCAAVGVPGEVYLIARPIGGHRGYEELLHEIGHVPHFALADPSEPWELRELQDDTVCEAQAFLVAGLLLEQRFLENRLGMAPAEAARFREYAAFLETYLVRRYCVRVLSELEFHATGVLDTTAYAEATLRHLGVTVRPASAWQDLHSGLYSVQYLEAWVLAAQLREWLRGESGDAWFEDGRSGRSLRGLWRRSGASSPQQLLDSAGLGQLDRHELVRHITGPGTVPSPTPS